MHDAAEAALVVERVDPSLVRKQLVADAHSDTSDEIDATIGQVFESCVASLHSEYFTELIHDLVAEGIFAVHRGRDHIMAVDLVSLLGTLARLKNALKLSVLFLHELVDERNGGSSSEPFVRHAINLGLTSQILDIVRVLDEVEAELEEALVLFITRRELDVATLRRKDLVAG